MIKIIPLYKMNPWAWTLMPLGLQRIEMFVKKYDTDSSAEVLCNSVMANFITDNPMVLLVVAVRDMRTVGHLLASVDMWCEKKFVTILQYDLDEPIDTGILKAALDQLGAWGLTHGAENMQVLAQTRGDRPMALSRMFERYYGFKMHRVLMRKPI